MNSLTTFDSTKMPLLDILRGIGEGKTQLPDFQRGWVWDDEHIRSLLASISLSYPIGAVMLLETGNPDVRFKPRVVEGVSTQNPPEPEWLILDGQQRLTSLYLALYCGKPVATTDSRGNQIKRWYYLDINKALSANGDREDAIIGLPEDRRIKNFRGEVIEDYSTPELEFKAGLFPLCQVFDCSDWRGKYNEHWDYDRDTVKQFDAFEKGVVKRFEQYLVPLITLKKPTPKEAVCQVFEKVNTGGVPLNVFELLTATFAIDDFNLRDDWAERRKRLKSNKVLHGIENTDFLQAVTLLATRNKRTLAIDDGVHADSAPAISCKRKDILKMTLGDYKAWADPVTAGFEKAAKLLFSQKVFSSRDVPYRTQMTPLAAILAVLGDRADRDGVRSKLARWYWCGVLGELYGGAIETRFAKDLPDVLEWIDGGPEPTTVSDAYFAPARLLTLRTRNSAAYKGVYALLLRDGALDFKSGEPIDVQVYFDDRIDIHHIFPKDWSAKHGIGADRYDSVVNKTPIAAVTNRIIGNNPPSVYLERIQRKAGIDPQRMDDLLCSHVIDPATLHANDFDAFYKARESALLERIENAMGKPIAREAVVGNDVVAATVQEEEDEEA